MIFANGKTWIYYSCTHYIESKIVPSKTIEKIKVSFENLAMNQQNKLNTS